MHPSLKYLIDEVQSVYGKLGDAQVREMCRLFEEETGFRHLSTEQRWRRVNEILASEDWQPQEEQRVNFSGDEYPDIFSGTIDTVDMGDLL